MALFMEKQPKKIRPMAIPFLFIRGRVIRQKSLRTLSYGSPFGVTQQIIQESSIGPSGYLSEKMTGFLLDISMKYGTKFNFLTFHHSSMTKREKVNGFVTSVRSAFATQKVRKKLPECLLTNPNSRNYLIWMIGMMSSSLLREITYATT